MIACGNSKSELHPNELNYSFDTIDTLPFKNTDDSNLSNRLSNATLVSEIDKDLVLGTIADVEIDSVGNIYLLDQDQIEIYKFNSGKVDTLGNRGRGPGEMTSPISMEIIDNNIFVCDLVRGVVLINKNKDDSLDNDDVFPGQDYMDIKVSENGLYTSKLFYKPNPEGKLKTIDFVDLNNNQVLYSVGDAYISDYFMPVHQYSQSVIEYIPGSNTLLSINYHSPVLSAYQSGDIKWEKKFPDFLPFQTISNNKPPLSIKFHEKHTKDGVPFDEIKTLLHIDENYALLQMLRNDLTKDLLGKKLLDSYIINSEDGSAIKIGKLPNIMAITDSTFVTFEKSTNSNYKVYKF